ncbi:MAG: ShlB/FhaC/HecB family hemolysin secretion/activation protein [Jannaschia sp.]
MRQLTFLPALGLGLALCLAAGSGARAQSAEDLLPPQPAPGPESEPVAAERPVGGRAITRVLDGAGFLLGGIAVEGNTAIPTARLQPIWAGLIGREVGITTLDAVAAEVTAAYRAEGYLLSQAVLPAQEVEGGVVRLQVIEGVIDTVRVTGGAANQRRYAERIAGRVTADRPLRIETLERSVLLLRDSFGGRAGESVETVLGPSPDTFGAADLDVVVTPQPVRGYVTADNRGSRFYGDVTLGAGLRSYNLLGLNERLDGTIALAPDDASLAFASVRASAPIQALTDTVLDGARLELGASLSRADPDLTRSGAPSTLTSVVDQRSLSVGMTVPIVRTRSQNVFGRLGLEWTETDSRTGLAGIGSEETDRLVVLEAGLSWDRVTAGGAVNLVNVALRQGLDLGGARIGATGPAAGEADFTLAQVTLSRLQPLGDARWSLLGEAFGQYSADTLPTGERFALGGATVGRGFAPGNTTGDSGFGFRVELRRAVSPPARVPFVTAAEIYGYGDYGRAFDRSAVRDGDTVESLGSVGIGARVDVNDRLTLTAEIARQTEGRPSDTIDGTRETRLFLGAIGRF